MKRTTTHNKKDLNPACIGGRQAGQPQLTDCPVIFSECAAAPEGRDKDLCRR